MFKIMLLDHGPTIGLPGPQLYHQKIMSHSEKLRERIHQWPTEFSWTRSFWWFFLEKHKSKKFPVSPSYPTTIRQFCQYTLRDFFDDVFSRQALCYANSHENNLLAFVLFKKVLELKRSVGLPRPQLCCKIAEESWGIFKCTVVVLIFH